MSERPPHRGRGPGTGTKRKEPGPPVRVTAEHDADNVTGPTWCDTRAAASILGCLPDGVSRLVEAGRLIRRTKPGCFPFFSRREVVALADSLRKESE